MRRCRCLISFFFTQRKRAHRRSPTRWCNQVKVSVSQVFLGRKRRDGHATIETDHHSPVKMIHFQRWPRSTIMRKRLKRDIVSLLLAEGWQSSERLQNESYIFMFLQIRFQTLKNWDSKDKKVLGRIISRDGDCKMKMGEKWGRVTGHPDFLPNVRNVTDSRS